jgi:cation diffusion facilitator family transporter
MARASCGPSVGEGDPPTATQTLYPSTRFIVRMGEGWWERRIPDYGDTSDPAVRARYGYLEGYVSIAGNVLLFAVKVALGLFIGSIALLADGVHSLSDVATSAVVILGFRMAAKPPDADHPFGHGRVEYIATLVIAVLLAITGIEFIVASVDGLRDPSSLENEGYAVIVALIVLASAVAKEAMARYSSAISRRIGSDVLEADAWHHRSDAISSVGVAIAILGTGWGLTWLDPFFGVVVALIIIAVAYRLVRTASSSLIGEAPPAGLVDEIDRVASATEGVEGVHDIAVHDYWPQKVITLHAEVRDDLVLDEAHEIADRLDARLREVTSYPTIIHLEPAGSVKGEARTRRVLESILVDEPQVVSYHRVQVIRRSGRDEISLHLIVHREMSVEESHDMCHRLERSLEELHGPCKVIVHFEPCVDDCLACRIECERKEGLGTPKA